MENSSVKITSAKLSDIDNLIRLQQKHLLDNLTDEQLKGGFIRVSYNIECFQSIILNNDIVIAKDNDRIIGYYLLGHSSNSETLHYQRNALQKFILGGKKLSDLKIACGAQAVLEREYRGKKLTEKMLRKLIDLVSEKYEYLFSSITKTNINALKVHKNSGYMILGEDDTKYFVCLNLNGL